MCRGKWRVAIAIDQYTLYCFSCLFWVNHISQCLRCKGKEGRGIATKSKKWHRMKYKEYAYEGKELTWLFTYPDKLMSGCGVCSFIDMFQIDVFYISKSRRINKMETVKVHQLCISYKGVTHIPLIKDCFLMCSAGLMLLTNVTFSLAQCMHYKQLSVSQYTTNMKLSPIAYN